MWRSESDLLFMAQEHNRDLVRQAEAARLNNLLNGTLVARIKAWWAIMSPAFNSKRRSPVIIAAKTNRQIRLTS